MPPQVLQVDRTGTKVRCNLSDGKQTVKAVLASQLTELVNSGSLKEGAIAKLLHYNPNMVNNTLTVIVTDMEVMAGVAGGVSPMEHDSPAEGCTPGAKSTVLSERNSNQGVSHTPGPTPSHSEWCVSGVRPLSSCPPEGMPCDGAM